MTIQNPPIFIQAGSHPAEDVRRLFATQVYNQDGVVDADALVVTEKSGTPDMSVDVAGGRAFIAGDEATYQGVYFAENRGSSNIAVAASDPTNPRIDLVVMRVRDSAYSGATDTVAIEVVTGTPAASPVAPTLPDNSLLLATVDVAALVSTIVDADITDGRTRSGQGKGTVPVFATVADRDAELSVGLTEGMTCYITDITGNGTPGMSVYTGSAWKIMWSEWEDFTVSWDAGVTVGNGTYPLSRYAWIAPDVYKFQVEFLLGTTSAITAEVQFDFPQGSLGARSANDLNVTLSNAGTDYLGFAGSRNGIQCDIQALQITSTYVIKAATSSTVPFTWGSGDRIVISGTVGV